MARFAAFAILLACVSATALANTHVTYVLHETTGSDARAFAFFRLRGMKGHKDISFTVVSKTAISPVANARVIVEEFTTAKEAWLLATKNVQATHFIVVESTTEGPFTHQKQWWSLMTPKITTGVRAVGPAISCHVGGVPTFTGGAAATDFKGMEILRSSNQADIAQSFLTEGHQISSFAQRGVTDWASKRNCNNNVDPIMSGLNGVALSPVEVLFGRFKRQNSNLRRQGKNFRKIFTNAYANNYNQQNATIGTVNMSAVVSVFAWSPGQANPGTQQMGVIDYTTPVEEIKMIVQGSVATFNRSAFTQAMAAFLMINPARLFIRGVLPGSVLVHFQIANQAGAASSSQLTMQIANTLATGSSVGPYQVVSTPGVTAAVLPPAPSGGTSGTTGTGTASTTSTPSTTSGSMTNLANAVGAAGAMAAGVLACVVIAIICGCLLCVGCCIGIFMVVSGGKSDAAKPKKGNGGRGGNWDDGAGEE